MSTEQKPGCSIKLDTPADIGEQLQVLQVHPRDNVVVALQPLAQGVALPAPFAQNVTDWRGRCRTRRRPKAHEKRRFVPYHAARSHPETFQGGPMAKGEQRSNKMAKKPKKDTGPRDVPSIVPPSLWISSTRSSVSSIGGWPRLGSSPR
mgnify:CR=1 FL=1